MRVVTKAVGILVGASLCMTIAFVAGFGLGRRPGSHGPLGAAKPSVCPTPSIAAATRLPTIVVAPTPPRRLSGLWCTSAVVVAVIDGDTVGLDNGERVRYIGIDAPESDECYGPEAAEMNRQLVEGKTVILIGDQVDRGVYGRLLRYVIADGRFVNAELVRLGYARAESYGDNVMFQQVLTLFERDAIESEAGLWSACEGE